MSRSCIRLVLIVAAVSALTFGARADAPHVYALKGARIVPASGAPLKEGTVLIRRGLVEAVGPSVSLPPDAVVIEARGMTVYPGLIDMGTHTGVDVPALPQPRDPQTRAEVERWKRQVILRPQLSAADCLKPDTPELAKLAAAGITSILATPPGEVVPGRSALVNVAGPPDEPQIGALAADRKGMLVLKNPVALHVRFSSRTPGSAYPGSLMGVIAFVRQSFIDAQHYELTQAHYERRRSTLPRPAYDPAMEGLGPAAKGNLPVAFEAGAAHEILRALAFARELNLKPLVTGGQESDAVVADLKSGAVPVLYSLNYPTRPRSLAPDADEPLRALRARANAPKVPAALEKEGILFAFQSAGLKEPKDFVRNAAKAVREGLSPDAAIRALTINAATLAGVADRLGSIEPGKIANLIVTDGDLFEEKTRIVHVFIDGRMVPIETATDDKPSR
jgi:imidazolonepropionase-like amidohydrolase